MAVLSEIERQLLGLVGVESESRLLAALGSRLTPLWYTVELH